MKHILTCSSCRCHLLLQREQWSLPPLIWRLLVVFSQLWKPIPPTPAGHHFAPHVVLGVLLIQRNRISGGLLGGSFSLMIMHYWGNWPLCFLVHPSCFSLHLGRMGGSYLCSCPIKQDNSTFCKSAHLHMGIAKHPKHMGWHTTFSAQNWQK